MYILDSEEKEKHQNINLKRTFLTVIVFYGPFVKLISTLLSIPGNTDLIIS